MSGFLSTVEKVSKVAQFVDVKGGSAWTDILTPTNSVHGLFVSTRVIQCWIKEGIQGYVATPRIIRGVKSKALKAQKPDAYFEVLAKGKISCKYKFFEKIGDHYEFRFSTDNPSAEPRARFMAEGFVQHQQLEPIRETWDGGDLICLPGQDVVGTFGRCFCSRRLVELAKEHQWSNLSFSPIDAVEHRSGDFRHFSWPPENWYSKRNPPSVFRDATST